MQQALPEGHPLAGPLALAVLSAAVLSFPVSAALLRVYRRRVLAGMSTRAASGGIDAGPPASAPVPAGPEPLAPPVGLRRTAARDLDAAARRRTLRAVSVYGAAGLAFASVMAVAWVGGPDAGASPMAMVVVAGHFAWPVVLSTSLVAARSAWETAGVAAAYVAVLTAFGAVAVARSDALAAGDLVRLWLILNGPGTVVVALCLARPVRAVGPLVLAFLLVATSGATLALLLAATWEGAPRALGRVGAALRLDAPALVLGVVVGGAVLLSPLGYAAGRWLGRLYDRKRISDQSITLDALWLVFAVAHSLVLVAGRGPLWLPVGALAFAAYVGVSRLGLAALRRRDHEEAAPRLLVLRAFALGPRSERLFRALTKTWRHVGSVQLICGPDLATTTLEPHEFLDFMHGRLSRRFIEGPGSLGRRLDEMDLEPDPDGRYRVNEFFCYDDAWRMVFTRLLAESDAVLMDLRRFSRQSPGLAFEVREVVRSAPLERVVFLSDHKTDVGYLEELAGEAAGSRADGGGDAPPSRLQVVRVGRVGGQAAALRALSAAAAGEPVAVR